MKQIVVISILLLQCSWLLAQEKGLVHKGNELYQQKKYREAETDYRKSIDSKNKNVEGNFNLGDALYKQKKFNDAGEQFNKMAGSSNNKALTAAAYHNLGNALLENKKLEQSIDAYKKALLNNPKDDETRYNLAYAQEKLKKQQQQHQQQNKQNKDNKNQDKKNQDKQNKDKNNQDKKNQPNQNQDKKDQQNQPDKLSKEDAERMLDALNNDEKQTQDKLKNKKFQGQKVHIEKDW